MRVRILLLSTVLLAVGASAAHGQGISIFGGSLPKNCNDQEVPAWNATTHKWECYTISGAGLGDVTASGTLTLNAVLLGGGTTLAKATGAGTIASLAVTGTSGAGYLTLLGQASNPSAPAAGTLLLHSSTKSGFTRLEQDNEAGTNLVLGRDTVFLAQNGNAGTLTLGTLVYISGSTGAGGVPIVDKAKANSVTTMPAVGVVVDAILTGAVGQVMMIGILENQNTLGLTAGMSIYVDATTAGAFTITRPSGTTNVVQRIGSVGNVSATVGSAYVDVAPALLNIETGTNAALWTGTAMALGGGDPADAGAIRLPNAALIAWEASPTGTDMTLTVDSGEQLVYSGIIAPASLGSGSSITTKFLRGDSTWQTVSGAITGTDTRVLSFIGTDTPAGDAGFTYNATTDSATLVGSLTVASLAYDATSWNGNNTVPTRDDVRDVIQSFITVTGITTGDLIIGTGTNTVAALNIGANNKVLKSNGTTASWQDDSTGSGLGTSLSSATNDILASTGDTIVLGKTAGEAVTFNFGTSNELILSSTTGVNYVDFGGLAVHNAGLKGSIEEVLAVCQGSTASLGMNIQASGAATTSCGGSTIIYGITTFPNSGDAEVQGHFRIPDDWDGAAIALNGQWRTAATSGDVVWKVKGVCGGDAAVVPTAYSSTADSVTETAKGTTLQQNDFTISLSVAANHSLATCAAGKEFYFTFYHEPADGADTVNTDVAIISALSFYYGKG